VIIIADDLTGANDTAIQYRKRGYTTIVETLSTQKSDISLYDEYQVVACNTNSRALSRNVAYDRVFQTTISCLAARDERIYKKVDSMLRGNPGIELDAVMDASKINLAFVAPAYPQNGRIVEDGVLAVQGTIVNAGDLFLREMRHKVERVDLSLLKQSPKIVKMHILKRCHAGIQVFLFDSQSEADLLKIAQLSENIGIQNICCGSAGFAFYVGNDEPADNTPPSYKLKNVSNPIGIVCGTRNQNTRMQIEYAANKYKQPLFLFESESAHSAGPQRELIASIEKQLNAGAKELFLAVSGMYETISFDLQNSESRSDKAHKIATDLGRTMHQIFIHHQLKGIIATGGDTALQVCKALGAHGIVPLEELAPGIPLGIMVGGVAEGVLLITKSGGFGEKEIIEESIELIRRKS